MARTCTKLLKIWIVMAGRPFDSGSDYSVDSRFFLHPLMGSDGFCGSPARLFINGVACARRFVRSD
jgi:hypothetical protein